MYKSNYNKFYLRLCQLFRVSRYCIGTTASYVFISSNQNMQQRKRFSDTKHTFAHTLKSPFFETNKGTDIKKVQGIGTLKDLFNDKHLEKYVNIPHLYRY